MFHAYNTRAEELTWGRRLHTAVASRKTERRGQGISGSSTYAHRTPLSPTEVFKGSWAEVIRTEAIFARHNPHNPHNPLPALPNPPYDVDLVAASASEMLTTEKVLKPRSGTGTGSDDLAGIAKEWNIRIAVGKNMKSGEGAQQACFLESLIALKKKRGESDQVTVFAKAGDGSRTQYTHEQCDTGIPKKECACWCWRISDTGHHHLSTVHSTSYFYLVQLGDMGSCRPHVARWYEVPGSLGLESIFLPVHLSSKPLSL